MPFLMLPTLNSKYVVAYLKLCDMVRFAEDILDENTISRSAL
jgi:hypothetical protein